MDRPAHRAVLAVHEHPVPGDGAIRRTPEPPAASEGDRRRRLPGEAAGILTFSTLTPSSPFIIAVIGYVLFGTGTGMWIPGVANVAMRDVPPGLSGTASGVFNASRQDGSISIGLAILGAIGADAATSAWTSQAAYLPAQPGGRRSGKPETSPAPASAR